MQSIEIISCFKQPINAYLFCVSTITKGASAPLASASFFQFGALRGAFAESATATAGFAMLLVSTICISPAGAVTFADFVLAAGFAVAFLVAFALAGFSAFGAASVFAIGLVDTISILESIVIGLAGFALAVAVYCALLAAFGFSADASEANTGAASGAGVLAMAST